MPQVRTIEVLRAARKLVANPETWCSGHSALDDNAAAISCDDDRAVRFCSLGAIARSACEHGLMEKGKRLMIGVEAYAGQWKLLEALDQLSYDLYGSSCLQDVNDLLGREAALSVIDAAISELVQRGEG